MDFSQGSNLLADRHHEGNRAIGLRPSRLEIEFINMLGDELVGLVEEASLVPDYADRTQVKRAVRRMAQSSSVAAFATISSAIAPAGAAALPADVRLIYVHGHTVEGRGGAEYKRIDAAPTHVGKFQDTAGQWWELHELHVTPEMFGAVGDGATHDTDAVNAAITFVDSQGGDVRLVSPDGYKVSTVQMIAGCTIIGSGHNVPGLIGDGTGPTVKAGGYVAGNPPTITNHDIRGITLRHLRISNEGGTAVQLYSSPDWLIHGCHISAIDAPALDIAYSYRGACYTSVITSSGTYYAVSILDNCNGVVVEGNTITGGSLGGGVNLGQSQSVAIRNNVFEICGLYGIRVAHDSGQCYALDLTGNYFEAVARPFGLGLLFRVTSVDISGTYSSQTGSNIPPVVFAELGRVSGLTMMGGGLLNTSGSDIPLFSLHSPGYPGTAGLTPSPDGIDVSLTNVRGHKPVIDTTDINMTLMNDFAGTSDISVNHERIVGREQVWTSPMLTANVASSSLRAIVPTEFGGRLVKVEIFDKSGTCACIVDIGYSGGSTETATFDPETLIYDYGFADATAEVSIKNIRAEGLIVRNRAGTGTGTFRIRVTAIT